jgi:hypothetical protein
MHSTPKRALAIKIADIQLDFNMRTNDAQIIIYQILDIVSKMGMEAASEPPKARRRFDVVRTGPMRRVGRSMPRMVEMYTRYAERDLYVAFLNEAVGRFESFLADVLRVIFIEYPQKLALSIPGISPVKTLPLDAVLLFKNKEDIISFAIDSHLNSVFYGTPRTYMKYVEDIIGCKFMEISIEQYIEIKATRDLLTHGAGIVNRIYLAKAGRLARESEGNIIPITRDYFDASMATMKTLAGFVRRDARKTFGK